MKKYNYGEYHKIMTKFKAGFTLWASFEYLVSGQDSKNGLEVLNKISNMAYNNSDDRQKAVNFAINGSVDDLKYLIAKTHSNRERATNIFNGMQNALIKFVQYAKV